MFRFLFVATLVCVAAMWASVALAAGGLLGPNGQPLDADLQPVVEGAKAVVAGGFTGAEKVAAVAGLIVTLLVQCLKSSMFNAWLKGIDRRKRILVPLGLAGLAGVIGPWLGLVGWEDAVKVACETAAASVLYGEGLSQAMNLRTGDAPSQGPAA